MKESRYNVLFEDNGRGVAYNSRSGAMLEFDQAEAAEVRRVLASPGGDDLPALRARLLEHGLLIADDVDELVLLEERHSDWKVSKDVVLTIALTQACNFDCPYCFEPHISGSGMSEQTVERVLKFVERQCADASKLVIDWYGGEPLLAYDLLLSMEERIQAICAEAGCAYESSISTNGSLLTGERAAHLAASTGVRSVRICIDGPADVHNQYRPFAGKAGTFDIIWRNVQQAAKHLRVKVRVNVDRDNEARIPELLQQIAASEAAGHGVSIAIKPIISARIRPRDRAYTPKEWAEVEPGLKSLVLEHGLALDGKGERSCSHCIVFSERQFMIDPKGYLYKCSDTFAPEEAVGTILDDGLTSLYEKKIDPWLEFPTMYDAQCRSCAALPLCMGGCTFRRIAVGSHWCGAERYNLEGYARLRYRQSVQQRRGAIPIRVVGAHG